ncbi:hypothetical protein ACO1O0_009224 [Amphichorda felina]
MAFSWVDPDPSYMELHVLSVIPDIQTERFVIDDIPCPIGAIRFWVDEVLERNRDMMIGWTMEDQNIWIHSFRVFLKKMIVNNSAVTISVAFFLRISRFEGSVTAMASLLPWGIYRSYKRDLDSVIAWLMSTARAFGLPAEVLDSMLLKPQNSTQASKYLVRNGSGILNRHN